MKKFIYLMAMVCTLGFFTACSSDDDDNDKDNFVRNEKIEGTWGLQEVEKIELEGGKGEFYKGSVKITWDCPADTKLNIDFGGGLQMPMDVKDQILPLMNNMANEYLPQILKNVTFTRMVRLTPPTVNFLMREKLLIGRQQTDMPAIQ